MKYCIECGKPAEDFAKFCQNCGNSFSAKRSSKSTANEIKDEIEDDGEGEINISLAKSASKIDFDVEVPYETMTGTPIRDLIRSA
jgi:uncharacterized membrane protein YvbJ